MDLFSSENSQNQNLLPFDGAVNYYGLIMSDKMAKSYFDTLLEEIEWEQDKAIIFGKTILTKRKVAWYGDEMFSYTYSGATKFALPWTKALLALKQMAEKATGETYNSCLLNLYHSGNEGMAWHSDAEKDLKKDGAIASISLGATRKFAFKHKLTAQKVTLMLENGSLLLMKGTTQTHWLHRLPPTQKVQPARINLTFRTIIKG